MVDAERMDCAETKPSAGQMQIQPCCKATRQTQTSKSLQIELQVASRNELMMWWRDDDLILGDVSQSR